MSRHDAPAGAFDTDTASYCGTQNPDLKRSPASMFNT